MRAALASVLAVFMAQTTLGVEAPIPGYTVVPLEWDVEVAPGRHEILNGTVQEVYAKALELNPNFRIEARDEEVKRAPAGASRIDRRAVNCGTWPLANKRRIEEGISYLRGVSGAPRNGPGPGNCGRVSCSYSAAIWWCNDNTTPKTLDSWHAIANSAQHIVNTCAPRADAVSGQNFEASKWNTIVRGQSC